MLPKQACSISGSACSTESNLDKVILLITSLFKQLLVVPQTMLLKHEEPVFFTVLHQKGDVRLPDSLPTSRFACKNVGRMGVTLKNPS